MSRSESNRVRRPLPVALAALALASATLSPGARAAESYGSCAGFIESLPATVTAQGVWCLRSDLATAVASGSAITVAASNVTIDCNGFKVGGLLAGPATSASGIRAASRQNVVVRRCNVRGFAVGIDLSAGSGHVVEANRLDGNTLAGIWVSGASSVIRGNLVVDTGGGSYSAGTTRTGIVGQGGTDIRDNTVSGVSPADTVDTGALGIYLGDGFAANNRVNGLASPFSSDGLYVAAASAAVVEDNVINATGSAHDGIACSSAAAVARGNTVNGFASNLANCSNGGGNVHRP